MNRNSVETIIQLSEDYIVRRGTYVSCDELCNYLCKVCGKYSLTKNQVSMYMRTSNVVQHIRIYTAIDIDGMISTIGIKRYYSFYVAK